MQIYIAGVPGGGSPGFCKREKELSIMWNSRLHSYYHLMDAGGNIVKQDKIQLFLDSGAFSAWTKNVKIDIYEYIDFIKRHEEAIEVYANLDVIGDAEGTYKNQKIMERAGLHPIPIYHHSNPYSWLEKYISEGYKYIALGGMVPVSSPDLVKWLDRLYIHYLTDDEGWPTVKVHGFGMTSLKIMLRYPWYSIDSTSWIVTGRMGSIFVPRYEKGKWLYDENSWKIAVSNKSPSSKDKGKHISTLPPRAQQTILDYIHTKGYRMGKSSFKYESQQYELKENEKWAEKKPKDKTAKRMVEVIEETGISNSYKLRDEINIIYFTDLEKETPDWPWQFKTTSSRSLF